MLNVHRIPGPMAAAYLIETGDALFLVDAGFVGHGRAVLRAIRALGRHADELRLALVTHAHLDHFGGLAELRDVAAFEVGCHPAHVEALAEGRGLVSPAVKPGWPTYVAIARRVLPRLRIRGTGPVTALADGESLHARGLPGRIVHTPGHSPGCISLLLDEGTAIVGDLVQGKRLPTRMPELPSMAVDADVAHASWRHLLDQGARRLLPAHAACFTAEELLATMRRDGVECESAALLG
ncbi:MAG: MBL fold metallo-hydrolase [Actinomycetota bacterium]|nr:MBL fold metallo-hydrolase [Actinomycetota bacterium]